MARQCAEGRNQGLHFAEKQWLVTKTLLLYCTHCIAVGLIRLVVRNPHPEHVRVNVTDDSWFVVLFAGGRDLCWDQADDDRVVPFSDVRWQLQLSGQVAAMLVPLANAFVKLEHFVHRSEMVCTEMCQTIFNFNKENSNFSSGLSQYTHFCLESPPIRNDSWKFLS